jgi:hypothetical protein
MKATKYNKRANKHTPVVRNLLKAGNIWVGHKDGLLGFWYATGIGWNFKQLVDLPRSTIKSRIKAVASN